MVASTRFEKENAYHQVDVRRSKTPLLCILLSQFRPKHQHSRDITVLRNFKTEPLHLGFLCLDHVFTVTAKLL